MKINLKFTKAAALSLVILAGVAAGAIVANADTTYEVQAGDTISTIVQKYHLDATAINKIAQINHLNSLYQLNPGQVLWLPGASQQQTGQTSQKSQSTKTNVQHDEATDDNGAAANLSPQEQAAKDWIAWHESRGEYTVSNGQYYGKYQLDISYLHGDLSEANQERTAQQYVEQRYGSWVNAKAHWEANGWY